MIRILGTPGTIFGSSVKHLFCDDDEHSKEFAPLQVKVLPP